MNYFLDQVYLFFNSYYSFFIGLAFSLILVLIDRMLDYVFSRQIMISWRDKIINTRNLKKLCNTHTKITLLRHKHNHKESNNIQYRNSESLLIAIKCWIQNKRLISKECKINSLINKYHKLLKMVEADIPASKNYLPRL